MRQELQKKIDRAIKLLQQVQKAHPDEVIEVAYSGGKDSDVILQLAKEAGIKYEAIYKNTTIDPAGTISHAEEMGATIIRPKMTFYQIIEKKGLPNRMKRFCCEILKEYKVKDVAIMGIRKEESIKRGKIYNEPTQCRFYGSKKEHVEAVYPILDWTLEDVAEFIQERGIKCAPHYYTDGVFHPERRLGCIGCPMGYYKNRRAEFEKHPLMIRQIYKALVKFYERKTTKSFTRYQGEPAEQIVRELFFDTQEEFETAVDGLFGRQDCKAFLENYFKIKL